MSKPHTQVLQRGPQLVDQRAQLIDKRICPRPRALQEWIRERSRALQDGTRRVGDRAQTLDERTHILGEVGCDLFEARGV